ncbi:MAG: redox-regulated ATPase YchF [Sulfolobales archaeon]|nr:redox-regulated ATPase YchF [Sulfolobales archaeon]MDW8082189.1 redox-regulated ATPase YchF [Sulfolobales archaeon]
MPPQAVTIGVVGKTNVGKTTFFSAATLLEAKIENRPFVTIEPNVGIAYVRKPCAHVELGLSYCNPKNSICFSGYRFIPVKLYDVAGLIKGAHRGRGLGNKFMDDLRQADVLLHVVDMSGETDEEGNPVRPGYYDPLDEIESIEYEINEWFHEVIVRDWDRFSRGLDTLPWDEVVARITRKVSGLSIRREHVVEALRETRLENTKPGSWREGELRLLTRRLREHAKPIVIVANKMDIPEAEDNYKRALNALSNRAIVVPVSSLFELALRKAARSDLIKYTPGDADFQIVDESKLTIKQKTVLDRIRDFMKKYGGSGVQKALDIAVFNVLKMIVVYPVENISKLSDKDGNVLPDAYLVKQGTTALELAELVHTELARGFIAAHIVNRNKRTGADYRLSDGDVVKIVSATARG